MVMTEEMVPLTPVAVAEELEVTLEVVLMVVTEALDL
jgi:hypothetical protein